MTLEEREKEFDKVEKARKTGKTIRVEQVSVVIGFKQTPEGRVPVVRASDVYTFGGMLVATTPTIRWKLEGDGTDAGETP